MRVLTAATMTSWNSYSFLVVGATATHIHAEPPEGEVQEHGALGPHAE